MCRKYLRNIQTLYKYYTAVKGDTIMNIICTLCSRDERDMRKGLDPTL